MNNPPSRSSILAVLILLVVLTVVGCVVGPNANRLAPAQTGQGISVMVATKNMARGPNYAPFTAELLAVRDDAILVRMSLITLVSYPSIGRVEVEGLSRLDFGGGAPPTQEQLEELRLLSRYPQGVGDVLLRRLLDAYGQEELHTIP